MKSNFSFFPDEWGIFNDIGTAAENSVYRDPNSSLVKLRSLSERITEAIFKLENMDMCGNNRQVNRLNCLVNRDVLPEEIASVFHTIRRAGNDAAHNAVYGTTEEAIKILDLAYYMCSWFMEVYVDYTFEAPPFRIPKDIEREQIEKINELEERLQQQEKEFEEKLKILQIYPVDDEDELRRERRQRSRKYMAKYPPNEQQTRVLIDEQLRRAGWEVDTPNLNNKQKNTLPEKGRKMAIAEWRCGTGYADYALFNGLELIGIVEAKKYDKDVAGDLLQAKEYARNVELSEPLKLVGQWVEYKAPFIYVTNGRPYLKQLAEKSGVWFWDARYPTKSSYPLESWHSPSDLLKKLEVDESGAERELEETPYPDFAARYYQIEAVKSVEKALADNKRRMLLAMATGTGKTRTALSLMYRLIKTKRVRRILFLVDRTSLGKQAANALKDTKIENISFSDIYDVKEVTDVMPEDTTKIQISTVQGMVRRLFYQEDGEKIPSVGTYDFIIVDEAHRGYTEDKELSDDEITFLDEKEYVSQYRRVIDYFDAGVLGLTATPALHTTEIFGKPIYTYSYTDAVVDGFLIDHDPPYKFETELSKNGIHFVEGEEVNVWDPDKQGIDKALLEDELSFDVKDFNRKVITESFNQVILTALADHIDPNDQEKTLIFAATDNHADMIVRLLKAAYEEKGIPVDDDAIVKITGSIRHPNEEIKRFKNEKYPNIAVTVDLLTTGIDVPEICNLVFLRRVKSRILYDQMLGRATRLCPEIGKTSFKIFDAVHLYDTLQDVTDMKPLVTNPNLKTMDIFDAAIHADTDEAFGFYKAELIAKLQRRKQSLSSGVRKEIEELNDEASLDDWLQNLKKLTKTELEAESEKIQRFIDYRSIQDPILIAEDLDELLSIERGYGEGTLKPGDYLNSFNQFIRDNMNLIPALHIVVNRPKELTREDLRSIRLKLNEKQYSASRLQKAWKDEKNEVIAADIISFIRQVALGSPLVDHETRVKNAMKKVYEMNDWTSNQEKWLQRIEKQLIQQSVLGPNAQAAFDDEGIFKQYGGYKRMKSVFQDYTEELISTINDNLYA
ncbi:type I restriction-modification system endonuclease [Vagococcus fluvialis]|uniref:type I restriction-modification system endonuclease n=1 Tax=Vagococcus fluvialis TaxID=2738 RepID=UPI0020339757|nr:type I restriction-modification system endonuclease [Vagococcus fluvialis]MCM2138490.1 type I restriction-modification system endonuclease [Vagococcus fluvialis]